MQHPVRLEKVEKVRDYLEKRVLPLKNPNEEEVYSGLKTKLDHYEKTDPAHMAFAKNCCLVLTKIYEPSLDETKAHETLLEIADLLELPIRS